MINPYLEGAILGTIQGVAEWLPISSKAMIILTRKTFFDNGTNLTEDLRLALFLHIGTFLAALWYLRREVFIIGKTFFNYKKETGQNKNLLHFVFTTTLASGLLGLIIYISIQEFEDHFLVSKAFVMGLIGFFLLITSFLEFTKKRTGVREMEDIKVRDGFWLGLVQGLAAFPGLSRSGSTVALLLFRRFLPEVALRLSFLVSLPIVLVGNIALNYNEILHPDKTLLIGLIFSFCFGLATLHLLTKMAKKMHFGYFTLFFGLIALVAAFI
jgi:undecaprenyl-diphosphatase